jgi:hypothetical protein
MFAFIGLQGWHLPSQILTGLVLYIQTIHRLDSTVPYIGDIMAILVILLGEYIILYRLKIFIWVFAHIPIIGKYYELPGKKNYSSSESNSTIIRNDSGKVIGSVSSRTTESGRRWRK